MNIFYEFLTVTTVFVFGGFISLKAGVYFGLSCKRVTLLYGWHSFFSIAYVVIYSHIGGDALMYYEQSFSENLSFWWGTNFIILFTSLFTRGIEFSFLAVSLIFNIIGTVGLLAFDASLKVAVREKSAVIKLLASAVVLLPAISFWSAGLGKDAISFTASCIALWAAINIRKNYLLFGAGVVLMFIVRPHIAGLMVIALGAAILVSPNIAFRVKTVLLLISLPLSVALVKFVFLYIGLREFAGIEDVIAYIEGRQLQNLSGGSSFDLKGMAFGYQLFTFMFRPLPFDAHNTLAAISAIGNAILAALALVSLRGLLAGGFPTGISKTGIHFMWVYILICWSIIALTTANMGLAVRHKWMVAPFVLFFIFIFLDRDRQRLKS